MIEERPDTIFLHDLKVETVIGIWEWERKIRQTVSIDLDMGADIRRAAATDSIEDACLLREVEERFGVAGCDGIDHGQRSLRLQRFR